MTITRDDLEKLNTVFWWLAECGEEHKELADAVRGIYHFCQNKLDELDPYDSDAAEGIASKAEKKENARHSIR